MGENVDIWAALGVGLAIGLFCGVALMCVLAMASRTSRSTEYMEDKQE